MRAMQMIRLIKLEMDVLAANDKSRCGKQGIILPNTIFSHSTVSSPGSGKTTLLLSDYRRFKNEVPLVVIEGDQQTINDAERIRATGCRAIQINTGENCHLDAEMIKDASGKK